MLKDTLSGIEPAPAEKFEQLHAVCIVKLNVLTYGTDATHCNRLHSLRLSPGEHHLSIEYDIHRQPHEMHDKQGRHLYYIRACEHIDYSEENGITNEFWALYDNPPEADGPYLPTEYREKALGLRSVLPHILSSVQFLDQPLERRIQLFLKELSEH